MSSNQLPEVIIRAASVAAADERLRGGVKLERLLVEAFRDGLGQRLTRKEYPASGLAGKWRRVPGGIDLALFDAMRLPTRQRRLAALMEMKVGKLDEALWDLIKLATLAGGSARGPAACLVYAADRSKFDDPAGANCSPLFRGSGAVQAWRTSELLARWPKAWAGLLKGSSKQANSRNFPLRAPSVICTQVVAIEAVAGGGEQEIRIVRVWAPAPDEQISFTREGWPEGVAPIEEATNKRRAPRRLAADAYPARFSDGWFGRIVPGMAGPEYRDLLTELRRRGWRDDEIAARVAPHRR